MSDGAAPVTTTATAPAASETSAPAMSSAEDVSGKSALAVLKEIREARGGAKKPNPNGLRLAKKDEEQAPTDESGADDGQPLAVEGDEPATDEDAAVETETADEEPPDDQKPTWAQKLRQDLAAKTAKIAEFEKVHAEREARFTEAATRVQHRIEDIEADVADERRYSAMLEKAIADAGLVIPADWKRAMLAERKAAMLERHLKRGGAVEQKQTAAQRAEEAKGQVQALASKFPELDWNKDADGKAWLVARFTEGGKGMRDLEADALMFVKALRYDRSQKAAAKRPAQSEQQPRTRPTSTTLAGNTAGAGVKRAPAVPGNEKESAAWLAARKAARSGR